MLIESTPATGLRMGRTQSMDRNTIELEGAVKIRDHGTETYFGADWCIWGTVHAYEGRGNLMHNRDKFALNWLSNSQRRDYLTFEAFCIS